ncbi:MAG TPA: Na+/H+ antiporter subunit E [Candidatus Bathyarchaeia archaeon]|nr:Na+/H+ antiporter subunit E [Candidatus Bathyarchaeia archaeon]
MSRGTRAAAAIWRGAGLFTFWLLLTGAAPADLAAGALAAALATGASLRLLPPRGRRPQLAAAAQLCGRFLVQSVVAGADVAWRALDPRLPVRPGVVRYRLRVQPGPARHVFSTLASLVPGTLPCGSEGTNTLLVHCLDVASPVAEQLAVEESLLRRAVGETRDDG